MGRAPREEEEKAAEIVGRFEGVQTHHRDVPGAPDATHDFDLLRDRHVVGGLEVTQLADLKLRALYAAIEEQGFIDAPQLTRRWYVALADAAVQGPRLSEMKRDLVLALAELELAESEVWQRPKWRPPGIFDRAIDQLPVDLAQSSPEGPGKVFVMPPSIGGVAWGGHTHELIQESLDGPRFEGERTKLAKVGGVRHLFAWVSGDVFDAQLGLLLDVPPPEMSVSLPLEVSTVWAGTPTPEGFTVWRSGGGPWIRLRFPGL